MTRPVQQALSASGCYEVRAYLASESPGRLPNTAGFRGVLCAVIFSQFPAPGRAGQGQMPISPQAERPPLPGVEL
jgi:hypothetical protein